MKRDEFHTGLEFYCNGKLWRCTDVGSRVIVAIQPKKDWDAGPPYAVSEVVFDEYMLPGCTLTMEEQGETGRTVTEALVRSEQPKKSWGQWIFSIFTR